MQKGIAHSVFRFRRFNSFLSAFRKGKCWRSRQTCNGGPSQIVLIEPIGSQKRHRGAQLGKPSGADPTAGAVAIVTAMLFVSKWDRSLRLFRSPGARSSNQWGLHHLALTRRTACAAIPPQSALVPARRIAVLQPPRPIQLQAANGRKQDLPLPLTKARRQRGAVRRAPTEQQRP